MPDVVDELAKAVSTRIRRLGCNCPPAAVIGELLSVAYHATLRTEEGRFIRGSITFVDPRTRPEDGPATRRASYPGLHPIRKRIPFTADRVVKLSRAIDMWSGSIAVFGNRKERLFVWGVVDQMVQLNIMLNREVDNSFGSPGIVTVTMDSAGGLSVYHGVIFLGGLRGNKILLNEDNALWSEAIVRRLIGPLRPYGEAIAKILDNDTNTEELVDLLLRSWVNTLSRICIGLRRASTGGTILITPFPKWYLLDVAHGFEYGRLGSSMILEVLDELYYGKARDLTTKDDISVPITRITALEAWLAQSDAEDRQNEVTGAVKLVTSLASLDGLVLVSPLFQVHGFGVKIRASQSVGVIYDGAEYAKRGVKARRVDAKHFGTRHNSVLRYCKHDKEAVGVVVSQDGQVRIVTTQGRSLLLWDSVRLLGYRSYTAETVRDEKLYRKKRRRSSQPSLGYTDTPKTLADLLATLDH